MMIEFPKIEDLRFILESIEAGTIPARRGDTERAHEIVRRWNDMAERADGEEKSALERYFKVAFTNVREGRARLSNELRDRKLPRGDAARRLKDLLLKLVVPYLRMSNPKYIAQRQREKARAESSM